MKKKWFGWMSDWQGGVLVGVVMVLLAWGIVPFLIVLALVAFFGLLWWGDKKK